METIGIDDRFVSHESLSQLRESLGIDVKSLFDKINEKGL